MTKSLRHKNFRPASPGEIIREMVLPELAITQTEFAKRLGVSRRTVSEILHERRPITPDMAIRFERLIGSTADFWLRLQHNVDLWNLQRRNASRYSAIKRLRQPGKRKAG